MGKKSFVVFLLVLFASLLSTGVAFAQRQLEVNYPEFGGVKPEATGIGLPQFVVYIFNFAVGISGLVILGILFYAGLRYFFSGDSVAKKSEAKKRIGEAVLGILIILGSYLILTTINPQLTFLNFPEITKAILPKITTTTKIEEPLKAQEIPLGYLLKKAVLEEKDKDKVKEGIFAETRILRVNNIYENISSGANYLNKLNEDLKILSENFKKISDSCKCENTSVSLGSSCAFDSPCPVVESSKVKKPEQGFCTGGDVCSGQKPALEQVSKQINQKRKEIFAKIYAGAGATTAASKEGEPRPDGREISKTMKDLYFPDSQQDLEDILKGESTIDINYDSGLLYWQNSLDYEIKDFQAMLGDFTSARDAIYNCQSQGGQRGHILLNYYDFERYRKTLRDAGQKEIVVEPWPNSRPSQDNSTFYCVEQDVQAVLAAGFPSSDLLKEIISPGDIEVSKESPAVCKEVIVGKVFDDTDNLGQRILTKLQQLYTNTSIITSNANSILRIEDLKIFIDEISSYGCNSGCMAWKEPWLSCHWETVTDDEGKSSSFEVCESRENPCCVINAKPMRISSKSNSREPQCAWYVPDYFCIGTPGTKKEPAPLAAISGRLVQFGSYAVAIKSSQVDIDKNLIPSLQELLDEATRFEDDKTEKGKAILEELDLIKQRLRDPFCSTSQNEWQDFSEGNKIIEKGFFSSQEVQMRGWVENPAVNSFYCCQAESGVK